MKRRQKALLKFSSNFVSTIFIKKTVFPRLLGRVNSLKLPSCNVSDLVQASQDLKSRDEFKTLPFPTGWQWCFIPVWAASAFCGPRLSPLPSCRSVCLTCLLNRRFRLHRQTQALLPRRPPPTAL